MTDTSSIRTSLALSALGFAAGGILAPKLVATTYGVKDPTPEHLYTVRIWAAATGVVGAVGLMEDGLDDERYLQLGAAMNLVDVGAALVSGGSARTRLMAAATSAAFAGMAAYGLRKG
jgi:hypothetical protein